MSSIDAATARQYVESGWWGIDRCTRSCRYKPLPLPSAPTHRTEG